VGDQIKDEGLLAGRHEESGGVVSQEDFF